MKCNVMGHTWVTEDDVGFKGVKIIYACFRDVHSFLLWEK